MHYGPNEVFRFSSYARFAVHAHMNSIEMQITGHRLIEFPIDGSDIKFNPHSDLFKNTFIGTLTHQIQGTMTYMDEKNGVSAELKFGNVKKKPNDYFTGAIRQRAGNGKWVDVKEIKGTYLGYVDFDGVRYWD